jgi:hypothetical protein
VPKIHIKPLVFTKANRTHCVCERRDLCPRNTQVFYTPNQWYGHGGGFGGYSMPSVQNANISNVANTDVDSIINAGSSNDTNLLQF